MLRDEKSLRAIKFAFAMMSKLKDVTYGPDNKPVKVKIGIHIGNVTAGIIGNQFKIIFILLLKIK